MVTLLLLLSIIRSPSSSFLALLFLQLFFVFSFKQKKTCFSAEVLQHKNAIHKDDDDKQYEANEVHGKFRITSERWSEPLQDQNSIEFQELSNTLKTGLKELLLDNKDLSEKADFDVEIVKLT